MEAIVELVNISDLLDKRHIGSFIGKKGSNFRRIEQNNKVIMQLEQDPEKDSIKVRLTGMQSAVDAAKIEIHELLLAIIRESFCHTTKIPKKYVGPLIGKKGTKIENIRYTTGARINFVDVPKDDSTIIEITGTFRQIVAATNLIKERIDSVESAYSVYERPDREEFHEVLNEVIDDY
ncbi:K domain containing protein [Trichostrongylus colubriformis]|uniref:K domain containing protein n=1 Tax=Trichostrongylus colubriformis TaxID=6319 RepID=A0AAN8FL53_TRICO